MARKTGQIIRCGPETWLVRIYAGRDPETGKRRYIGKANYAEGQLGGTGGQARFFYASP
jgi:hypothetical protein